MGLKVIKPLDVKFGTDMKSVAGELGRQRAVFVLNYRSDIEIVDILLTGKVGKQQIEAFDISVGDGVVRILLMENFQ